MDKKKVTIEVEVKDWQDSDIKVGDYLEYKGEVYVFEGYEHGNYPIARNVQTGEQIQLPHY
jgi:hypothetical protein